MSEIVFVVIRFYGISIFTSYKHDRDNYVDDHRTVAVFLKGMVSSSWTISFIDRPQIFSKGQNDENFKLNI